MSDDAKRNAKAHAETIEALYALHCWDGTREAAADLEPEAVELAGEFGWDYACPDVHALREWIETRAREIPLSVLVRSDWHVPGDEREAGSGDFELLLTTGGPGCRITGCLHQGEPSHRAGERPDVQWQDWGEPWTVSDYRVSSDALLWFCCLFYFGA